MSLSKYSWTLGLFGIVAGAEIIYHSSRKLRHSSDSKNEEEINEIIFTGSSGNYRISLVRNIFFVCGPQNFAAEVFLNVLLSSRKSVFVAVHVFTSNLFYWALIAAKQNGVDVRCVVDASTENEKHKSLTSLGIPVRIYEESKMHLNFCVIDCEKKKSPRSLYYKPSVSIPPNGIVITGSLNWTREALMSNEENFIVSSNLKLCEESAKKFVTIWEKSKSILF